MKVSLWVGSTRDTRSFSHDVCMRTPVCSSDSCQFEPFCLSNRAMLSVVEDWYRAARLRLAGPAPMQTVWYEGVSAAGRG